MALALMFSLGILVGAAFVLWLIGKLDPWGNDVTIDHETWMRVQKSSQAWRDRQQMDARQMAGKKPAKVTSRLASGPTHVLRVTYRRKPSGQLAPRARIEVIAAPER